MLPIIYHKTTKKNTQLEYDGFMHRKNRITTKTGNIFWKCPESATIGCPGSLTTSGVEPNFEVVSYTPLIFM